MRASSGRIDGNRLESVVRDFAQSTRQLNAGGSCSDDNECQPRAALFGIRLFFGGFEGIQNADAACVSRLQAIFKPARTRTSGRCRNSDSSPRRDDERIVIERTAVLQNDSARRGIEIDSFGQQDARVPLVAEDSRRGKATSAGDSSPVAT